MERELSLTAKLKERIDHKAPVLLITDLQSRILYANEAVRDVTGFSVGEAVGKRPAELWGGAMEKPFYTHMWHEIKTARRPFVHQVRNHHKNGISYQHSLHITPIFDARGETAFFMHLHPEFSYTAQAEHFAEEFTRGMQGHDQHQEATLQALGRWLGTDFADMPQPSDSIASFFDRVLITPTRERFQERTNDSTLIVAAQKEARQFAILYTKYYPTVYRYFLRHLSGDQSSSEDLSQETFMRAFANLPSFEPRNASYGTFLLRIAHNQLVNYFRGQKKVATESLTEIEDTATQHTPTQQVDGERLWSAMSALPKTEQHIMELKYRGEQSVREIATYLQKTENAVKLALSRARKKLKALM